MPPYTPGVSAASAQWMTREEAGIKSQKENEEEMSALLEQDWETSNE